MNIYMDISIIFLIGEMQIYVVDDTVWFFCPYDLRMHIISVVFFLHLGKKMV